MHAIAAGRLPVIHRDPLDRMLIAQARTEGLTLATRDEHILKYDVPLLHVDRAAARMALTTAFANLGNWQQEKLHA